MTSGFKYRGKIAKLQDIKFIKELIEKNPNDSRRTLSKKLCETWNWVQPNGTLRDMVCRGFLLRLESAGYIKLPPRKFIPNNPLLKRKSPAKIDIDQTPIQRKLSEIRPIQIKQVRYTHLEKMYNSLVAQYHYLGYCHPVGEHLKYIAFLKERPIACMAWSSAVRHLGCRDKFIGWRPDIRKKNSHFIVYNTRFLILPWVKVPYLASHLLGSIAKILPRDWQNIYKHPIYLLETFVDTERFLGISYRAANWIYVGNTTGRGKNDHTHRANRSVKAIWVYPLIKNFRETMQNG